MELSKNQKSLSYNKKIQHKANKNRFQSNFDLHAKKQFESQPLAFSLDAYVKFIGVLYTCWKRKNGKPIGVNFGTAFAIDQHHLITCTHNVYTNKTKSYATDIIFVPGISYGQVPGMSNRPIYQATILNKRSNLQKVNFDLQPIKEELTILYLEKPFIKPENLQFPKIGNIQQYNPLQNKTQLGILGYPSKDNIQGYQLEKNIKWTLSILQGRFHLLNLQKCQIYYSIKTVIGISGSPIFARNFDGQLQVVGIHTHSGREPHSKYNTGLLFTYQTLKQIRQITKMQEKQKDEQLQKNEWKLWKDCDNIEQKQQIQKQVEQKQQILKLLQQMQSNRSSQEKVETEKVVEVDLSINLQMENDIKSQNKIQENIIPKEILSLENISLQIPYQQIPIQEPNLIKQKQNQQNIKPSQQQLYQLRQSFNNSALDCQAFNLFQNQYTFCNNSDIEPDIINLFFEPYQTFQNKQIEKQSQKQRGKFEQIISECSNAHCILI